MSEESDDPVLDRLIQRVLEGDRSALEEFLLRHYSWLENYINSKIPPNQRGRLRSEDVIQEVYLRVFRNVESFQPQGRGQLFSWLQTIARNTLFDQMRGQKREDKTVRSEAAAPAAMDDSELRSLVMDLAVDQNPRASQQLQVRELLQAFRVALGTLPEDYRRTIELLYIEQKSMEEAAEELDKTVDALRGIRTRARTQLRTALMRLSRFV